MIIFFSLRPAALIDINRQRISSVEARLPAIVRRSLGESIGDIRSL